MTAAQNRFKEALNKSLRMRGSRIGMECKADFAVNSGLLARNPTQQTAQARLIARRGGLVQRFLEQGHAPSGGSPVGQGVGAL